MRDRSSRPGPSEPILHVDLDAFYASVEVLKDPRLAGRPVVVGNPSPRGVIMSASYEARAAGLHSAMPSDFDAYRAYSNRFREILLSFTPAVEPLSLDEAFLDVGGARLLFGAPESIAQRIRSAIRDDLSLTASVGVAPTKLVAKLASTRAKPDGMLVVRAAEVIQYVQSLPVSALWGVGERTAGTLGRLGIRTVEELARTPPSILERALGEGQAAGLMDLALGKDDRPVVPFEAPKSVSHEETYPRDLDDPEEILREILALCHRVAARLRADGYRARTVTLKLRLPSFTTLTRSRTRPDPTDVAADLFAVGRDLLLSLPEGRRRFRLLGVAATGLVPAGEEQVALVRAGRWGDAERALDRINRRFGADAAVPAALLQGRPPHRGSGRTGHGSGDRHPDGNSGIDGPFL
jgi:DNA polymerase-4